MLSSRVVSHAVFRRRDAYEQVPAFRGDRHACHAPVIRVGLAAEEAVRFELGDHAGDARWCDLLPIGELAEGQWTVALHDREGRELARREPGVGLLAEPAGEAGRAEP